MSERQVDQETVAIVQSNIVTTIVNAFLPRRSTTDKISDAKTVDAVRA